MSDGITDAVKTDQQILDDYLKKETEKIISKFSTNMLVDELSKRDTVKHFNLQNENHHYTIHITGKHGGLIEGYGNPGPVHILVVNE